MASDVCWKHGRILNPESGWCKDCDGVPPKKPESDVWVSDCCKEEVNVEGFDLINYECSACGKKYALTSAEFYNKIRRQALAEVKEKLLAKAEEVYPREWYVRVEDVEHVLKNLEQSSEAKHGKE